ncbi:MAG: hypothetical protein AABX97_08705, partial [Candidatus Thermoplasmatota archaeon]
MADASPLIHLARIGRLSLIPQLYRRAVCPASVVREVVTRGHELGRPDAAAVEAVLGDWLAAVMPPAKLAARAEALRRNARLGEGESDAILLAEDLRAPLLTDDALAARTARARGIDIRWTTSLVLEAAAGSVLSKQEARGVIEELVRSGLRIAPAVLLELLRAL